ncbi:MAG TPA: PadR family transcriptional regulator [Gemmatimonadales bacterium]|nr:PadR family transcriptional regulator [Gemmatimonadales bacterium]
MAGSDLFTGSLDLLILKALSWGPMHGYAIGLWLRQQSGEALPIAEGALYPALHRLERQGHLEEEWGVTDTNRDAKFYRLTRQGRRQLQTETERWRRYSRIMDAALNAARP